MIRRPDARSVVGTVKTPSVRLHAMYRTHTMARDGTYLHH